MGELTEPFMKPDEVAGLFRCTPQTVNRMAREGKLPARRFGRSWRFLRSQLDEWFRTVDNQAAHKARVEGTTR